MAAAPRHQSSCTLDIFTCGMEKRAIAAVAQDSRARRVALWREVAFWQRNGNLCGTSLAPHMMREACVRISRPSRLYAQHVAAVSAATEL